MLYLETSVLVCAITHEADTGAVQAWLARQDANELSSSDWVVTEFSSALSIKSRTGQMSAEHRAGALSAFTRMATETLHVLSLEGASFRKAEGLAEIRGHVTNSGGRS